MTRTLISILLVSLAATAFAGPPADGVYQTTDIGGTVAAGRYTEAWAPGGGPLMAGTTLNAESWDGASLGTEWSYSCGVQQTPAVLISDFVDGNGNGSRTYEKTFTGGTLWLSGTGPWAGGDAFYSGPITQYTEYETIQYVGGNPIHAVTNVSATAQFDGYPETCIAFSVANGVEIGSTDAGDPMPMNYPDFLGTNCTGGLMNGAWWDMITMSLYIDGCTVSNDDMTWGEVKSMYRN